MKTLYKSIVTALLSGTALIVAAQGVTFRPQEPAQFEIYDRNGDGAITAEEFNAVRNERRAIRAAEGRPMRNVGKAPTFEQIDVNTDGALSPDEMAMLAQQRMSQRPCGWGPGMGRGRGPGMGRNRPEFAAFDLNSDGVMTEDEFTEAHRLRISERVKQGYRMRGLINAPSFTEFDQDSDGVVSEAEFSSDADGTSTVHVSNRMFLETRQSENSCCPGEIIVMDSLNGGLDGPADGAIRGVR